MTLQKVNFKIKTLIHFLEQKRHKIAEEIRAYPPPIPACDAQFNHLLEERSKLSREIRELQEIEKDASTEKNNSSQLQHFLSASDDDDSHSETLNKLLNTRKSWSLCRQDDNGNRFRVQSGLSYATAQKMAADFEAKEHKQLYWLQFENGE